jgi:hypothetical protein
MKLNKTFLIFFTMILASSVLLSSCGDDAEDEEGTCANTDLPCTVSSDLTDTLVIGTK